MAAVQKISNLRSFWAPVDLPKKDGRSTGQGRSRHGSIMPNPHWCSHAKTVWMKIEHRPWPLNLQNSFFKFQPDTLTGWNWTARRLIASGSADTISEPRQIESTWSTFWIPPIQKTNTLFSGRCVKTMVEGCLINYRMTLGIGASTNRSPTLQVSAPWKAQNLQLIIRGMVSVDIQCASHDTWSSLIQTGF